MENIFSRFVVSVLPTAEIIGKDYEEGDINMRDTTRKVMILNNLTSPYISEAIIILKDYDPEFDTKAIQDAERIVNDYLNKKNGQPPVRSKKILKYSIITLMMGICFILGYLLPN